MAHERLDNPVWASLTSTQATFARGSGRVRRYDPAIAPFVAVDRIEDFDDRELAAIIDPGEFVYFVGPTPSLSDGWKCDAMKSVLQMVCWRRSDETPAPAPVRTLSSKDAQDMVNLTSVAFPGFFRERTHELGTYHGIFHDDELIAMAGERMALDEFVEISAVCTHPDHTGHGYARHLMTLLINSIFDRGLTPFLHVGPRNARAHALYESLGFADRAEIPLLGVTRKSA